VGWTIATVMAYALPAALVWLVLGGIWGSVHVSIVSRSAAAAYAAVFGIAEVMWLRLSPPSSGWGVPARWVEGRGMPSRTVIWGTLLGPGLVTKNPYAGIWLLPLLMWSATGAAAGALVGLGAGLAHGSMRAWGVRSNARDGRGAYAIMLRQLYWRYVDGAVLLFAAAALAASMR
jgi:hypothetical protein